MATYDIDSLPASFNVGDIINCPYSGTIKSITLPSGKYKFELWGGGIKPSGMNNFGDSNDKRGGYTVGNYSTTSAIALYLVSGGAGSPSIDSGYNGGGSHNNTIEHTVGNATSLGAVGKSTNGGGATHIALVSGLLSEIGAGNLSSILAVAGGAGGPGLLQETSPPGFFAVSGYGKGGGITGLPDTWGLFSGQGGSQSAGGEGGRFVQGQYAESGSFGKGGAGNDNIPAIFERYNGAGEIILSFSMYASGGGGGLYGGGGAGPKPDSSSSLKWVNLGYGGGGSGYVSGLLEEAATYNPGDDTPGCPGIADGHIRITVLRLGSFTAKVNGLWTPVTPLVKVNNTWKNVKKSYVKVNGVWKEV